MTLSLGNSYKMAKKHLPELDEHEFVAGLLMALVDTSCLILGFDKNLPKKWAIDIIIDLLKNLKNVPYDK